METFVIQIRRETEKTAETNSDEFRGLVEHVGSGRRQRFVATCELLAFLRADYQACKGGRRMKPSSFKITSWRGLTQRESMRSPRSVRRYRSATLVGLVVAASLVLALGAADARAVITTPIPADVAPAPPPFREFPAAGVFPPPTAAISDPVEPAASCGIWYLQSNYGGVWNWQTNSTWWEYDCWSVYPQCVGACNADYIPSLYIDSFYWDGTRAVFYGEFFADYYYRDEFVCLYWWDKATSQWYVFVGPGCGSETGNADLIAQLSLTSASASCSFDGRDSTSAVPGEAQELSVSDPVSAPAALGSKIAFTRTEDPLPGAEDSDEAEIWVMNGDGTDMRQLTHNTTFDLGAVWSPDGQTVAFYSADPVSGPHIFLIGADGGEQMPLTAMRSRWPSWSTSGKIAFDNGGPTSGDIFVINPDGSGLEQLTNSPAARNIRPDWSPNGQKIAFASRRDGNDEIYVMNADGSEPTRLTNNTASDTAPAWSPDGRKIVFQSNRDGNIEIYSMNADGTDQTRLTDYPGRDQDPDWSPDGRTIAFERDGEPIIDLTLQVFVMNADGTNPTPLTGLPSENTHPGWGRGHLVEP